MFTSIALSTLLTLAPANPIPALAPDYSKMTGVGSPLTGHTDTITSLALSSDGKLLASGSKDKTLRLWKPA